LRLGIRAGATGKRVKDHAGGTYRERCRLIQTFHNGVLVGLMQPQHRAFFFSSAYNSAGLIFGE
jgi:hypothetical protein